MTSTAESVAAAQIKSVIERFRERKERWGAAVTMTPRELDQVQQAARRIIRAKQQPPPDIQGRRYECDLCGHPLHADDPRFYPIGIGFSKKAPAIVKPAKAIVHLCPKCLSGIRAMDYPEDSPP